VYDVPSLYLGRQLQVRLHAPFVLKKRCVCVCVRGLLLLRRRPSDFFVWFALSPSPQQNTPMSWMREQKNLSQYRLMADHCTWRLWRERNESATLDYVTYGAESHLHELMLQSEHRTLDPEEADFFYVPVYLTCQVCLLVAALSPLSLLLTHTPRTTGRRP
jgi:hypothetical protein